MAGGEDGVSLGGNTQAEMSNHWLEVAIVVQQSMPVMKTKCSDDEIDSPTDSHTNSPEKPEITGRQSRDLGVQHTYDPKAAQITFHSGSMEVVACSLKHL